MKDLKYINITQFYAQNAENCISEFIDDYDIKQHGFYFSVGVTRQYNARAILFCFCFSIQEGKLLSVVYRNPTLLHLMWADDTKLITASPETPGTITIINYW